ncbi:hypothetical protein WJX72_006336 [[Myrmecia] bisecta]|uniref:Uncharacterized protein n=1 Tax=[Myrmecia] bisecta TaxID=41462 RepID=A0AAW1QFE4_9CHLO
MQISACTPSACAVRFAATRTLRPRHAPSATLLQARPPLHRARHRHGAGQVHAEGGNQLERVIKLGNSYAETASSLIPDSVPRPLAKAGVLGLTGVVSLWLLNKVVSTALTVAVLAGAVFLWYKVSSGGDSDEGGSSSNGAYDDSDDPLSSAKRIMDKYK